VTELPDPAGARLPATAVSATVRCRVRFDECGPDGFVRTSTLLRLAQDVAWVHADELGINREWSRAHGLSWLVRAAEVTVLRPIEPATTLDVTTVLGGTRRVLARRRTEFRLPDGVLAAWSHTDWVVIDDRGQPARLPPDFLARVQPLVPGSFEPLRLLRTPTPHDADHVPLVVRAQDLDPWAHVNNAAYLDYLDETLLASADPRATQAVTAIPRRVRVEYLRPAGAGWVMDATTWPIVGAPGGPATWAWRLTADDDGEVARATLDRDDRAIGG
jgi:acyl-CoA thioesterase FadM